MTLLLSVSCTFDYGALKGAASEDDGGIDAGARDALDATTDVPTRISEDAEDAALDAAADAEAEDGPGAVDASRSAEVTPDVPGIVMADAALDGVPSTAGTGGSDAMDTGGAGGSTSSDAGDDSAGGSAGGGTIATGGVVGSGGAGSTGGVTDLGGSTLASSPSSSGGQGGTTGSGGTGGSGGTSMSGGMSGTSLDGGVDAPAVDASLDGADGAVDGDEGDVVEIPLVLDTITATPTSAEFGSTSTQNQMKLDFYSVSKSVTLVEIEQYLTPAAMGTPLHWVVYRSSAQTGLNSYVLLADVPSPSNAGSGGYQSSPPLNIVLEAGAYYAIGVYWQAYSTTYWYHNSSYAVGFPIATSFGGLLSALASSTLGAATVSWTAPSNMYYPQRLSTR